MKIDFLTLNFYSLIWIFNHISLILSYTKDGSKIIYRKNETIPLSIGKINSRKTQIPYRYYDYFPMCKPNELVKNHFYLGEILTGDITYNSKFEIKTLLNQSCAVLCETDNLSSQQFINLQFLVKNSYYAYWFIEDLPAAWRVNNDTLYNLGLPLGKEANSNSDKDIYLYNHFKIHIHFDNNDLSDDEFFIVGFEVEPKSIKYSSDNHCSSQEHWSMNDTKLRVTYDVVFEQKHIAWKSRWNVYSMDSQGNSSYHWFSILNSSIYIIFFGLIVGFLFTRAVRKDIEIYNSRVSEDNDDVILEAGWKQVCNDVFRKPNHSMLFCAFVSTGIQLFCTLGLSIMLAICGVTSSSKGSLLTLMILLFVFMGICSGFISAKLYKVFQGNQWLKNSLLTCTFFPILCFIVFFFNDILLWIKGSSAAVPIGTIFSLILLWLCCSAPLILIGSFIGLKSKTLNLPCKINAVPSRVPDQPLYTSLKPFCVIGGLVPFCTSLFELIYVMSAIWKHYNYALYGFFFIVMLGVLISCSEASIILVYYKLCRGDYKWWWRSFFISGSCAFYIFAYSIYFYLFDLETSGIVSTFIYFSYMTLLSFGVFLILGSIGFLVTYGFLIMIYSLIKIN